MAGQWRTYIRRITGTHLQAAFSGALFATIAFLAVQLIQNSRDNQRYKQDYAELHHFKHGLFNVDAWKEQIGAIIAAEVDQLALTQQDEAVLRAQLARQLVVLIDKMHERLKARNGKVKQAFIEAFVDIEELKRGAPEYAAAILAELKKPRTEARMKDMLKARIDEYLARVYDKKPRVVRDFIITHYGEADEAAAKDKLGRLISRQEYVIAEQALILVTLAILLFAFEVFQRRPLPTPQFVFLGLALLALLAVGVSTPMIDMEAKITQLSFMLFDHPIEFEDQVLFFQSKSIIDVFWLMITHKEIMMKLVAVLLVTFSVIFPLTKLLCSLAYFTDVRRARSNPLVAWFVLKSGKWSMADVYVVATFMAYIGFNGVVNSQLENIRQAGAGLEVLTTNGTTLRPGFYVFVAYTLLAMCLSGYLGKRGMARSSTES